MRAIEQNEQYINFQSGQIYFQQFSPENSASLQHQSSKAVIVLLHESLGSVALWKQFPQALANATGRQVIAYDRLGFGRSSQRFDFYLLILFGLKHRVLLLHWLKHLI